MKRIVSLLCSLVLIMALSVVAFAEENDVLLQATVVEDKMDLFVAGDIYLPDVSVKTANKITNLIDKGTFSEKNVRLRTTILVDVSASVSVNMRDSVVGFIKKLIRDLGDNDEIRIATFDSQLKILQDFTSDRYDLDTAADGIVFNGKQSALFDAIHNTIPDAEMPEGQPCFYSTIVLTDGSDNTVGGITMEELFMELKSETYPIDVICVSEKEIKNPNKNLSALTRISNGRYFALNSKTDINKLQQDISVDGYKWIRVKIPAELLDGSIRQVDITDGNTLISFDLKMKAADIIEDPEEQPVVETTLPIKKPIETTEQKEETEEGNSVSAETNTDFTLIIIIAAAVLAVVAIIIIVVVSAKNADKKKKQAPVTYPVPDNNKTEFYSAETEFVGGDSSYTIKLENSDNPGQNWVLNVSESITIGRNETCTIVLNDKSVSREQCRIDVGINGLYITNISNSNLTKLNNVPLSEKRQLRPNDELKMGRVTLRVEYIQIIGAEMQGESRHSDISGDETQNIFR